MNEIELKWESSDSGAFVIEEAGERVAKMVIGISGSNLTVFHTEVSEKLQGRGIAARLLAAMAAYAREHRLKVIPLCSYVSAQFKRHPEEYADIRSQDWHPSKNLKSIIGTQHSFRSANVFVKE